MAISMGLAEHEGEGHYEELIALVVVDMQDPVTPILEGALVGEGSHDTGRMIARFGEVLYHGAAAIDENLSSCWCSGNRPGSYSVSFE
jgi:hypothetical protein